MSKHYPSIRVDRPGPHFIREGLTLCFYMKRPHVDMVQEVMQCLDTYLRVMGTQTLQWYLDHEGEWQDLDEAGWELTRRKLLERPRLGVELQGWTGDHRYGFIYRGKNPDDPILPGDTGEVCALSIWLPTEYLEEHGPGKLRELALELASALPFCSGHAGLSFHCETQVAGMRRKLREYCFRYPGLDIPELEHLALKLGTRVRGPAWLTFLGQPVLGALGGVTELRARLSSPGTTVQELNGGRAVVTLGLWPEAGDTEQGQLLPAYRELARILEPWLYREEPGRPGLEVPETTRRWERRFLD
jgi:TseV toxin immunity protein TsiV